MKEGSKKRKAMNDKNIFLFQAVVLCVFLQIGQLMAKTEKKLPMRQSICLLRGSNGAGSGFFTNVNGKDCVITNNHVALELKDMKICNVQGKEYNFDKIYSSTHEDLAFIPIERDDHTLFPNLSIHPDPASLPDNAPVTVYGDSLGDGVIVALPGKLLGIGPKIIEVDSKFVPGNSGGPVMENKTQMVVGVATYCKIILQSSPAETGTRFEVNADRPSVRRFAIRIDKMLNDSFEELTQEQITHDQVQYQPIHEYHEKLMAFISSELGRKGLFWIFFNQEQIPALPREWKTVYLQKAAHEEMERIQNIYSLITHGTPQERKPQPLALEKEIKGLLQQYGSAIKSQKTASKKKRCFVCSGTGKFT